jgi:hypothetical protein
MRSSILSFWPGGRGFNSVNSLKLHGGAAGAAGKGGACGSWKGLNQCRVLRVSTAGARPEGYGRATWRSWAMGLLISILITFLVVILVLYLVNLLPIDGRAKQIVRIVVIIIGILYLLRYLTTAGPVI